MVKEGKNFSGKVTPLFDFMLVQQTKDKGEASERPSDSQPIPYPPHPKGSGENHGGQSSSDRSLSRNEDGLTLLSVYDLCISLCIQVLAQAKEIKALKAQTSLKKKGVQKEYVSKQGRKFVKSSKGEPSMHKDPAFDDLDDDAIDYIETEDAQDEGRTSSVMLEVKESADKEVSTEAPVSTIKLNEGTDKRNEGTDKQDEGTDSTKVSTDRQELHDTIVAQRKFLAQQRSEAIRNKPPIRNQLRNQMMTYLKHVGGKKHSELKTKTFEEIQVLYERLKSQDQNFVAIGSTKDVRQIKEMNEESKNPEKKRLKKRVVNEEDTTKVSSPDGNYLVVYRVNGHFRAFNYLMEVLHIFDRQDLFHLYDLVMKQYSKITPEDIELILWGDLKIMMESSTEENDQELKDGTVIYMLVERKYPLSKELLQQMLDLGLEVEEESTAALQLDQTVPELAIPEQTATGKGIPNPLMAGSLPKTIKPTELDVAVLLKRQVADEDG
ncbi:hypothetical protein Tco_1272258 [Tanacetum coccineum]